MLILLDVGNTSVTYGAYAGGRLFSFGSCSHSAIPNKVYNLVNGGAINNYNVILSSVVPKCSLIIKNSLKKDKRANLWEVGVNLPIKIKHKYKNINKLGVDRIVNIYGAIKIYRPPLLIIDFGTAITFDYISKGGVFQGGMIIPGPEIAFQTLLERAALIPKSTRLPDSPGPFLGTDTKSCISSGIIRGYGAMADELIQQFRDKFGYGFRVLVTGGFSRHLKSIAHHFQIVDPRLSIKSLLLLGKAHLKKA